jgi:hypothetical protein
MDIQYLIAQFFNGLVLASIYIMLSIGLTIIFGMLGVVNFAHGAFYMLGAYGAYTLVEVYSLNLWTALLFAPIIVALNRFGTQKGKNHLELHQIKHCLEGYLQLLHRKITEIVNSFAP